jgi:hypothetical protein
MASTGIGFPLDGLVYWGYIPGTRVVNVPTPLGDGL